jgi:cullin 1
MENQVARDRENVLLHYATEKSRNTAEIPLEEGWEKIKTNGVDVLVDVLEDSTETRPFGNKGYVSLYTISYRMCSNAGSCDHSKALYDRSIGEIESVLRNRVVPELQCLKKTCSTAKGGEYLLQRFSHHWTNHKIFVKWMQQLFRHLDNGYVANSSMATLTSVGLNLFRDIVFAQLKIEVRNSLVDIIERDRDDKCIDPALIRICVGVFPTMGLCSKVSNLKTIQAAMCMQPDLHVYEHEFENYLLERTSDYYARQSQLWLEIDSTPIYLKKTETALEQELRRVRCYLHTSSECKLLTVCENELLQAHKKELIDQPNSGMTALLAQDQGDDLKRMFLLFRRIPQGVLPMALTFKQFVLARGNEIFRSRENMLAQFRVEGKKVAVDDPVTVEKLLAMHRKMKNMVEEIFDKDNRFQRALKEALQDILNSDASQDHFDISNAQILVMYTDRILGGKIKLSEEELEKVLDELLDLFLFLSDKDLYSELYREQLARRLLSRKCVSLHAEKSMIVKMKTHQGAPFTTKLEGMINDFTVGIDLDRIWKSHCNSALAETSSPTRLTRQGPSGKLDFSVQVLTQGFWPTQKYRELHLSREMVAAKADFDAWYTVKHSHRILSWVYALGDVTVKAIFGSRSYDITIITFQAMALLHFSGFDGSKSFHDICEQLNIDPGTGKRVLHSLACGKHKTLHKSGSPRTINSSADQFSTNNIFTSKLRRFCIQISALDAEAKKKIDHEVQQQRCYNIDATLVRLMKARKRLAHQELVGEVIHQTQTFKPDNKLVRQRIEGLIEREYLQRDATDSKMYIYMP